MFMYILFSVICYCFFFCFFLSLTVKDTGSLSFIHDTSSTLWIASGYKYLLVGFMCKIYCIPIYT